ncbi:23863_t:CDS:1, partial [Cetraspora pellucida]
MDIRLSRLRFTELACYLNFTTIIVLQNTPQQSVIETISQT